MLMEYFKPDFVFENNSGCLTQLVHNGWKQINVITSRAGSVRGGHYHKYNDEGFYVVSGRFTLTLWRDDAKEIHEMKAGDLFRIQPYVFHTFAYSEDTVLVSMYSRGVELSETEKDIWTK